MNVEENRLRTFTEWPTDNAVSPARIARAGFFAINTSERTVQCFACGVRIAEWNYGDQVMAKHRRLSPQCPFVLDPSTSGNVPKVTSSTSTATRHSTTLLADESVRLQTFNNWPIPEIVTPESLARAGFYFLHQSDKTKCAFCDGVVGSWEVGDDPDREHRRHFPSCPFVQLVINTRLQTETDATAVATNSQQQYKNPSTVANLHLVSQPNFYELGIQAHTAPKRPRYATLESRLNSFTAWPPELIQTPEVLSQAGFYYEGRGDQVRCFHCDGGLRHWDPQDDPWTEHARWFPRCSYVKLVKGQEFVDACAIEQNNSGSNLEEVQHKSPTTPTQRKEITDRELQMHMISPPALAALEVGLHVGRVKQALREKLTRTGSGFSSADALIEATLNLQRDEEDINESPPVPQAMSNFLEAILEDVVPQQSSSEQQGVVLRTDGDRKKPKQQEVVMMTTTAETKQSSSGETAAAAVVVNSSNKTLSLEEENRLLKEARLCKICMDNEVGIVFLPCGHLASCVNCAPNLQDCPVCRSAIKATVRTFLS